MKNNKKLGSIDQSQIIFT